MGGKAKTQKHTAKEINMKHKAAKERAGGAGGGAAGLAHRSMQKVGVKCGTSHGYFGATQAELCVDICLTEFMSLVDMRNHFNSRHPKENFNEEAHTSAFEAAKAETAKRREGKQQGKLEYKHKDKPATGSSSNGKSGVTDDVAALLAAGLQNF
jgi:hypothetical protein